MDFFYFLTPRWLTCKTSRNESKACLTPMTSIKNVIWMNILDDTSWRDIWGSKIYERCVDCTSWWVFNVRWHVHLKIKLGMFFVIVINWNFFSFESWNWWTNVVYWVNVLSCFLCQMWKVDMKIWSFLDENSVSLRNVIFRNSSLLLIHWLKLLKFHSRSKIKRLINLLLNWRKRSLSFIKISYNCICFTRSCINIWLSYIVERNSFDILRQLLHRLSFIKIKWIFFRRLVSNLIVLKLEIFAFIKQAVQLSSASSKVRIWFASDHSWTFKVWAKDLSLTSHMSSTTWCHCLRWNSIFKWFLQLRLWWDWLR